MKRILIVEDDRELKERVDVILLDVNLPDGEDITVNAVIKDETIWITQKAMAELFGIDKSGISRHLSNIFKSGEENWMRKWLLQKLQQPLNMVQ